MLDYIRSVQARDPADPTVLEVIFAYNGVHALALHRVNHWIWTKLKLRALPRALANIGRILTGIEIHPGAAIGKNFFIDHGTGVVIGQTAVIGDDVQLYHGVTLGGKGGEEKGSKRHPTLEDGAIIGAGAQVLGDITIGKGAKVGSNAVVMKDVPAGCVAVGNPARLVECDKDDKGKAYGLPRNVSDPYVKAIEELAREIADLKKAAKK